MSKRYTVTWVELCAFWGMVVAAFAHFFGYFINALLKWIDKGGFLLSVAHILTLLGNIALLVAIALPAYQLVKYRTKGWKIFYWISLVLFILSVVFGIVFLI